MRQDLHLFDLLLHHKNSEENIKEKPNNSSMRKREEYHAALQLTKHVKCNYWHGEETNQLCTVKLVSQNQKLRALGLSEQCCYSTPLHYLQRWHRHYPGYFTTSKETLLKMQSEKISIRFFVTRKQYGICMTDTGTLVVQTCRKIFKENINRPSR